jgi:hypothetical protein
VLLIEPNESPFVVLGKYTEHVDQLFLVWGPGAGQHSDLDSLRAEGLPNHQVAHVVLRDHSDLEFGKVIAVAFAHFVQVALVSDKLRVGIYREGGGHLRILILYPYLELRPKYTALLKSCGNF